MNNYQVNITHTKTQAVVASHQIEAENANKAVRAIVQVYCVSGGFEKGYDVSVKAVGR